MMFADELPEWLIGLALAEVVTPALVILTCRAWNTQAPDDPAGFLADLARDGVLTDNGSSPTGPTYHLNPDIQKALILEQSRRPGGLAEVRERLVRYAVVSTPLSLIGQIAMWASEDEDWLRLSALWLKYPPAIWASVSPNGVAVLAKVPLDVRAAHPALGEAAAMCLGLAETASFSTEAARAIRAGGWRLHSGWRNLRGVDSALRAGTMWMVAQRTMATSAEDLDDVWATYHTLKAFLNERSRAGTPPKARAETFFHAMAAETALLRGEMSIAREEAREAMVFGEPGDVSSLLGAATAALAQAMSGDVEGYAASAKWFERHAIGCGSFADIAAPVFHLARGLTAIRRLDREAAEEAMHLASVLTQGGEFWSVYAWIRALQDLVWSDGMHGLARLEATAARNAPAVGPPSITGVYEIQARTELLCGAGRINQDNALIKEESRHNRYHLVTEARIHLCGRDGASAVRVAERGLYDAAAELPDLAHLSTIRAAGLLSMDAEPEVVLDALEEACTFCTELENLLPFVYMPADLRAGLLTLHDTRGHHGECILSMPESRARLAEVRNNHEYSSALVRLTAREELLLPILATSATAEEIARNLQVSVNTVRKQVVTLRQKLDAHTRKAMIENAYRLGLLDTRPSEEPTNRPRPAL